MTHHDDRFDDPFAAIEMQMRDEFVVDCRDKIEDISKVLENLVLIEEEVDEEAIVENITNIRGTVHGIKGAASTHGFPHINIIAHRLEDYLYETTKLNEREVKEIYFFLDTIENLLSRETAPSESEIAEIIRTLPVHLTVDEVMKEIRNVEVLVVMPKNVQRRVVGAELRSCGFRTSYVHSSLPAIEMAMHTKPNLIIVSAMVDYLDGIQLAQMLQIPKATKDIPVILVTSFDEDEFKNKNIPENTYIARKGDDFPTDFAKYMVELKI